MRTAPSASGDPVYTFYHQRLREAADGAMSDDVRRARHVRFAALLEARGSAGGSARVSLRARGRAREGGAVGGDRGGGCACPARVERRRGLVRACDHARSRGVPGRSCRVFVPRWGKLSAAAAEFETLAVSGGDIYRVRAAEAWIKLGELDRDSRSSTMCSLVMENRERAVVQRRHCGRSVSRRGGSVRSECRHRVTKSSCRRIA